MSSEVSTTSRSSSSRLSQFGLYRNIDARTEEFLKLSKKRQIRQGCACAVISTALTVTIVIGILLIYEYNGYSHPNSQKEFLKISNITKNEHKDKSRHEGNNGKLNKKKHVISASTINLLNLLLKALNHTNSLESQEKNTISQTIEKVDTGTPFKRNVLSDIKNWVRIPNLRMLAEHKAPSIFYYRNPTSNNKFATNTRKLSMYPWKDISKASEEVLEKSPTSFVKTDHYNGISGDHPKIPIIMETTTTLPTNNIPCHHAQKSNCSCSKLSAFFCKVLFNIQELIPGVILNTTLCNLKKNEPINKAFERNKTASTLNNITDTKTTLKPKHLEKNKVAEKVHRKEALLKETGRSVVIEEAGISVVTEDIYKEYKKKLLTNTNKLDRANKFEKTHIILIKNTTNQLENHLLSAFQTNKEQKFTTTTLQPYIVEPELVGYLKYFIKSTAAPNRDKQHKASEKLHVTDILLDKFINTTDATKDNTKLTQNFTNEIQTNQYETSSENTTKAHNSTTIRNFVAVKMYKDNQKYLDSNTKSANFKNSNKQNIFQNRKNKIISKSPLQSVMKKMKILTERPEFTTVSIRPYIVAPESVKNIMKSITTTSISTVSTTETHYKSVKKVFDEKTRSIGKTTQEGILTYASTKNNYKSELNVTTEKLLDGAVKRSEMEIQPEISTTVTVIKLDKNNRTLGMPGVFNESMITDTTTRRTIITNLNTETVLDEKSRNTEITAQENTSIIATSSKQDNVEQIKNALNSPVESKGITTYKEELSATATIQNENPEQNLDIKKALDGTIRNKEIMTHESTSTDAASKECDKTKQNLHSKNVLDDPREIAKQDAISAADSVKKQYRIGPILETETMKNTIKSTEAQNIAKYFRDEFYEENKPFKDIKFARFDSFAANSNKHIILPSYKDLNFELFPVFKRHNTNAPKFDTNSELLVNNDPRMGNNFAEIMSSNQKDYYFSSSNEILNSRNPNNTNKTDIKESLTPVHETSPNWILQIKMMNNKIKETLEENFNAENQQDNNFYKITKSLNQNAPDEFGRADQNRIWTYNIDSYFVETTTQSKQDYNLDEHETTNSPVMKIILPDTKPSETNTNKQTVSISQLYDNNESPVKYLNRTISLKINETDKNKLNVSFSEEFTFFEDRIQEKLKFLRDTKSKANNNAYADVTIKYLDELMADYTEYNPSSMLPKSRPSYLEINRNFLNTDEDQDYQMKRVYYKQKRQNYDYFDDDILK